jgi:hypothetical protein
MTFDIEQIINNHQISLVPGVPDYRAIRKIEQEIHGEPLTPYPGEWDEISRVYHHKIHLRYTSMYISGCLWCEDRRQDREWRSRRSAGSPVTGTHGTIPTTWSGPG